MLTATRLTGYAVLATFGVTGASCLYRFGPDRAAAKWRWVTPGSVSAVVVLLPWLWLSAYVFLPGAELDAELEHQTEHDTTPGRAQMMGHRGAGIGDTPSVPTEAAWAKSPMCAPTITNRAKTVLVATLAGVHGGVPASLFALGGLRALRGGSDKAGTALLIAGAALVWRKRPTKSVTPCPGKPQ